MIQTFFIVTIAAMIIGVVVYLCWNRKPKQKETSYQDFLNTKRLVPDWMEQNNKFPINKGDRIICLEYGRHGLTGIVENTCFCPSNVCGLPDIQVGLYVRWETNSSVFDMYVARNKCIRINQITNPNVNHNKCELKEIKEGSIVIAEYFLCYQRVVIQGKLLGYNQNGMPVIIPDDREHIIINAKNILKVVSAPKKPKK